MHWFPIPLFNLRSRLFNETIYGFTLLYYQFFSPEKLLAKMRKNGWKVIRIYRKDSLNQSFSNIVAQKTALWHRGEDVAAEAPQLRIEPEELLFRLNLIMKNKSRETTMFENIEHLQISYEEDLENKSLWPETMQRVFDFLGTYPVEGKTTLRKTYSKPYSEIVENYDELIRFIESQHLINA
jgi:LPS sulfotransferase NodH